MLLNSALTPIAKAIQGDAYTALDAAHAHIGVGDSLTAAAKTQTDLQASSNKAYVAMDSTYPQRSGTTLTYQITAAAGTASYVWNEFTICDGSPGTTWSRFLQTLNGGVAKTAGEAWTVQFVVTVARNDSAN